MGDRRRHRSSWSSRARSRPSSTAATAPASAGLGTREVALVRGLGASPGLAVGRVRVLRSPAEGEATRNAGEVLVAPMTSPDWVPVLRRAGALVTDGGGMTCHAAIVSRELGVPCVVGTRATPRKCSATASWSPSTAAKGVVFDGDRASGALGAFRPRLRAPPLDSRRSSRSPRSCTSTWRWRIRPKQSPPGRSTVSDCCERSSSSPRRSAVVHPRALLAAGDRAEFVERMSAVAASHHHGVRTPPRRLPDDRLP